MNYEQAFDECGNAIVFKISRVCPVGCDFCCEPVDTSRLTVTEMIRWLHEAVEPDGLINHVGFTGGDPFVHFPEMIAVGKEAHSLGLPLTAVTSAFWAESSEVARDWLSQLREVGLKRLSLSCDPGHQKRVPLNNVRYALEAAIDLGLTGFVVGTFNSPEDSVENYLGVSPSSQYRYVNKTVAPFGKGKAIVGKTDRAESNPVNIAQWGCYRQYGHDILIQPDSRVMPCCSTSNAENPLTMGVLRNGDSIGDLAKKITGNFLLRILKHESFACLKSLTERHRPESADMWPDPRKSAGPCSYCTTVFSDERLSCLVFDALRAEAPLYWQRFVGRYSPATNRQ